MMMVVRLKKIVETLGRHSYHLVTHHLIQEKKKDCDSDLMWSVQSLHHKQQSLVSHQMTDPEFAAYNENISVKIIS